MKKAPQLLRLPKTIALLRLLCDNEHLGLKQTLVRQKKLRSLILLENLWKNKAEINKIEKLQVRLTCLEIACTALEGMHKNLYQLLPKSFKDYNKDLKNFFRFYYSIYAYSKNRPFRIR